MDIDWLFLFLELEHDDDTGTSTSVFSRLLTTATNITTLAPHSPPWLSWYTVVHWYRIFFLLALLLLLHDVTIVFSVFFFPLFSNHTSSGAHILDMILFGLPSDKDNRRRLENTRGYKCIGTD